MSNYKLTYIGLPQNVHDIFVAEILAVYINLRHLLHLLRDGDIFRSPVFLSMIDCCPLNIVLYISYDYIYKLPFTITNNTVFFNSMSSQRIPFRSYMMGCFIKPFIKIYRYNFTRSNRIMQVIYFYFFMLSQIPIFF